MSSLLCKLRHMIWTCQHYQELLGVHCPPRWGRSMGQRRPLIYQYFCVIKVVGLRLTVGTREMNIPKDWNLKQSGFV